MHGLHAGSSRRYAQCRAIQQYFGACIYIRMSTFTGMHVLCSHHPGTARAACRRVCGRGGRVGAQRRHGRVLRRGCECPFPDPNARRRLACLARPPCSPSQCCPLLSVPGRRRWSRRRSACACHSVNQPSSELSCGTKSVAWLQVQGWHFRLACLAWPHRGSLHCCPLELPQQGLLEWPACATETFTRVKG